jgi:DNA (cytosine-5)-methyltransferase 1
MGDVKFLSLFSGIEAASVAWNALPGAKCVGVAEIDAFPAAVLAHHYPDVPNLGDVMADDFFHRSGSLLPDIVVGGAPCQAFSNAGNRESLDDPRGRLTLRYTEIIDNLDDYRSLYGLPPVVIMFENVPGILNTPDNAFGEFLGKLAGEDGPLQPAGKKWSNAGCVFGPKRKIAWRIFDAQYAGVPQRRRRVFLVASAREGFNPAEVLFEFDGVRRDSPPSRQAGQSFTHDVAPCLTSSGRGVERTGDTRGQDPVVATKQWPADVTCTLNASFGEKQGLEDQHINGGASLFVPVYSSSGAGHWKEGVGPLRAREQDTHEMLHVVHGTQDPCVSEHTAFALGRNNGGENVIAFSGKDSGCDATLELAPTMRAMNSLKGNQNSGGSVAIAYGLTTEQTPTGGGQPQACMDTDMKVRRLMPIECERLQGFPDGWTQIPYRGKPADQCPDGARYKALGNSMAVPCMRFIGQRLWKQLTTLSATGSIATSTN